MRVWRSLAFLAAFALVAAAEPAPPVNADSQAFEREYGAAEAAALTDPHQAEQHADRARVLAQRLPTPAERTSAAARADWMRAEAKIGSNHPADAAGIAAQALATLGPNPPAILTANLLRSRGFAEAMLGKVEDALSDFQRAYRLFAAAGETRREALTLQDIGAIYSDAGDYAHMLLYYRQSAELGVRDPAVQVAAHHNIALALGKLGRPRDAQTEFTRALVAARALHNASWEARVLTELAESQIRSRDTAAAERTISRAAELARGDPTMAAWRPLIVGVQAEVAFDRGRVKEAVATLTTALKGVDPARTDLSYRDLHEIAAKVFRASGNWKAAFVNLDALKRLDGEAQKVASNTNAALMSARFDFQNQDLRITRLKASQLQQAVQLEHATTHLHRTVFAITALLGGALLVLMSVALAVTRRSRNQVRAANTNLSTANVALERALKVKTEFLATTSHEIRTPLNGILGMTQVLLAGRGLDSALRKRIEVVHSAGQTMRALVDDILDVAKLESGRVELDPEPISLARLFAEAEQLWGAEAERKRLKFTASIGGAPDRIIADEQRLRQILFNLLSNAIKFTDYGCIGLTAAAIGEGQAEALKIVVTDTGIGIAPELHEAIFESFRQADGGTTRRYGGTGLGLTICRRLATAMGGTVTVESEAGAGARFTLTVPLTRADPATDPVGSGEENEPVSLATSRILLVERNPLNLGIMRALLAPACREVVAVGDAGDAIALAATGVIDLVLADASTLGADAGAVAAAVERLAPLSVVLLATVPEIEAGAPCWSKAALLVAKPVAGADLIRRLCALFDAARDVRAGVATAAPGREAVR